MPSEYFGAIDQSPKTLFLIIVFITLCSYFVGLYFYVQKPKKGTLEWIRFHGSGRYERFIYEPLVFKDVIFVALTFLVTVILCGARFLIHSHLGFVSPIYLSTWQILLSGAVMTFSLSVSFYIFFRLFYTSRFVAFLVTCLSCALFSREIYSVILLLISWIFLYIWICNNYRTYKRIHRLYLLLAIVFYCFTLMSCWAAFYLFPIYLCGYIMGKVLQWHRGDQERKKGKMVFSLFLFLITASVVVLVMWLLYYGYNNEHVSLFTTVVSGDAYYSIIPTFLEKLADITPVNSANGSMTKEILRQDLFRPVLFLTSLIPTIYYGLIKKKTQALTAFICAILFLAAWIFAHVDIMCPGAMLSIGWMFKGFRDRGYKRYAVMISLAVIGFYFASLFV